MWFQKQRAEREERRGRQKRKEQPLKQEATSLEKAKREYDLWVLAEALSSLTLDESGRLFLQTQAIPA